jgi:SAM-dependent methyltransferase
MDRSYARERTTRPHLIYRYRTRARVVVDAARRYLGSTRGLSVVDLGSAEGRTLMEMDRQLDDSTFVGVECSPELLASVPDLPQNVQVIEGDACNLPGSIRDRTHDIVSALAVLEHLEDPAGAAAAARDVLRPGGLFVATCPMPLWDSIAGRLNLVADEYHVHTMDRRAMTDLVRDAGLELLSYYRFMWAPVGFLPYLRLRVPPAVGLGVDRVVRKVRVLDWGFVNQCIVARRA